METSNLPNLNIFKNALNNVIVLIFFVSTSSLGRGDTICSKINTITFFHVFIFNFQNSADLKFPPCMWYNQIYYSRYKSE